MDDNIPNLDGEIQKCDGKYIPYVVYRGHNCSESSCFFTSIVINVYTVCMRVFVFVYV